MEHENDYNSNEKRSQVDNEESPSQTETAATTKASNADIYKDLHRQSRSGLNAIFENPLANVPREKLLEDVETFCRLYGLETHLDAFTKGALVAQNPSAAQGLNELTDEEKAVLMAENTHKWSQPWKLYWLVGERVFFVAETHFSNSMCLLLYQSCAQWLLPSRAWMRRSTTGHKQSTWRYI
jgi:hypothetical protein